MNSSSAADFASATVSVIASVMAPAIILMLLIGAAATALVLARRRWSPATDALLNDINRLLPQTQCAQCGYPGCKPYAQAIASGEAINRCPPGGESTIAALADLLGRPQVDLDTTCGETLAPHVAIIREDECIGCTLCIQACPVDAIVGAQQTMHTVIEAACTGCDLCREPCPVDCIELVPATAESLPIEFPIAAIPCINCGECADACPRDLQPQLLHWFRDDTDRGDTLHLDACIECRRCDAVCPSEIPLTPTFRAMKQIKHQRDVARREADTAQERFEARDSRLIASTARVQARPSRLDREKLLNALKGPA